MYLGIGWAVQSWVAAAIITLLTAILAATFSGYRIPKEEKALVSEFGERYITYSRRVKRLIPFIF